MKKYKSLLFLFFYIPLYSSAQVDYYIKDTTTFIGNISIVNQGDKLNALSLKFRMNDSLVEFSPDEIREYGFKNGVVYRSFRINVNGESKTYFFKRLYKGTTNLYYLKTKERGEEFFITKHDSLGLKILPPDKSKYTQILKETLTECETIINDLPSVSLNKAHLNRLFIDYHECHGYPHPRTRFGLYLGLTSTKYAANDFTTLLHIIDFKNSIRLMAGGFLDIPLGKGNFSFHPELYGRYIGAVYSKQGIILDDNISNNPTQIGPVGTSPSSIILDYDMVINHTSLSLPLLLRYNFYRPETSLFFEGGPLYSRTIKDNSTFFLYENLKDEVIYHTPLPPYFLKNQFGYALGGGAIIKYGSNSSIYSALRYSQFYNLGNEVMPLNFSEIHLHVGLMF